MSAITEFLNARLADPVGRGEGDLMCVGEYAACDEWSEWHERTIAAQHAIIELHADDYTDTGDIDTDTEICVRCQEVWPCEHLRILATAYADHPDYNPEWKP